MTDTDIEITDHHFDELPALEFCMSRDCVADDNRTTTLELRLGQSSPHTTVRIVPTTAEDGTYHILWWTSLKGDDLFHAFTMDVGESYGYEMIRRILGIMLRYREDLK